MLQFAPSYVRTLLVVLCHARWPLPEGLHIWKATRGAWVGQIGSKYIKGTSSMVPSVAYPTDAAGIEHTYAVLIAEAALVAD